MLIEESSISMVQNVRVQSGVRTLDEGCTSCVGVLQHTGERRIPAGPPHSHTLLKAQRCV